MVREAPPRALKLDPAACCGRAATGSATLRSPGTPPGVGGDNVGSEPMPGTSCLEAPNLVGYVAENGRKVRLVLASTRRIV